MEEEIPMTKGDTVTSAERKATRAMEQAMGGQWQIAKGDTATTQTTTAKGDTATNAEGRATKTHRMKKTIRVSVSGKGGEIRYPGECLPALTAPCISAS